jgi:hypothetical protein
VATDPEDDHVMPDLVSDPPGRLRDLIGKRTGDAIPLVLRGRDVVPVPEHLDVALAECGVRCAVSWSDTGLQRP